MSLVQILKGTAASALAAAMMFAALPAQAAEPGQNRGDRGSHAESHRGGGERGNWNQDRQSNRGNWSQDRQSNRGNWGQDRQQRVESDNRPSAVEIRREAVREARTADLHRNPTYSGNRNQSYAGDRDRSYGADRRDEQRSDNRDYRNGNRDGRQADRRDDWRDRQQAYRQGYRDSHRADRRDDRNDYRRWDRDSWRQDRNDYNRWNRHSWRQDRRYSWQDYRRTHRNVYRLNRYYSPYRNYSYRRLSIGFVLNALFYTDRYWIDDPGYYRLPPVYGPYRWVRYYDDALLVNIYTGEVVDVIYDIFW